MNPGLINCKKDVRCFPFTRELWSFIPVSPEYEGDWLFVRAVHMSDAGPLVPIARHVAPPQPPRHCPQHQPTVLLLHLDLR